MRAVLLPPSTARIRLLQEEGDQTSPPPTMAPALRSRGLGAGAPSSQGAPSKEPHGEEVLKGRAQPLECTVGGRAPACMGPGGAPITAPHPGRCSDGFFVLSWARQVREAWSSEPGATKVWQQEPGLGLEESRSCFWSTCGRWDTTSRKFKTTKGAFARSLAALPFGITATRHVPQDETQGTGSQRTDMETKRPGN